MTPYNQRKFCRDIYARNFVSCDKNKNACFLPPPSVYKKTTARGFTLIEVLISISILLVAVVGPISLIGSSLAQLRIARDSAIAVNLATEGVEAVRHVRDSNMLQQWRTGNNSPSFWRGSLDDGNYIVTLDKPNDIIKSCGGGSCTSGQQIVYQHTVNKDFRQFSGGIDPGYVATPFSRSITISSPGSGDFELQVTSSVSWTPPGGTTRTIQAKEGLFGISRP